MANVPKKGAQVVGVQGETGKHSYSVEECEAFCEFINSTLEGDKDLTSQNLLPVSIDNIFTNVGDGVLLCKLINACVPDTIDTRVVNIKPKKNAWEKAENNQLVINSAKSIGCSVVNVGHDDLIEGRQHIVLGLIWQIIKIGLLQDINLKEHPELIRLLKDGEDLKDLLKLPPEQILIRWVNYQLNEAGSKKRIANFSGDIKDSEAYTILLKTICPNGECDLSPMQENDPTKRAEKMLGQAEKIKARKFVKARDVVAGNPKLNLAFVANLFNNYPHLAVVEITSQFAELLDFDSEGSREERVFRMWIQSLGIDCNNVIEDSTDGLILLKTIDKIQPGLVDWKKVDEKPKMKLHKVQNTNYVIELAEKMGIKCVNMSGVDIHDANKKIILALLWQLMRQNLLNLLKEVGGGNKISDDDVLAWANGKLAGAYKIDSFKDQTIKTGVFLCKLCAAIAPQSVNQDYITPGENENDAHQNAKYAISVARKIGATVFLLNDDIYDVKPKMIFSFLAALMQVDIKKNGLKK